MTNLPPRMQDTLYHDTFLPKEVIEVRDEVRVFSQREIEPVACEIAQQEESKENFPREIFNKMAEDKVFGIPFEEKWGGRGLKYPSLSTCVALEELAYASNSIASVVDVHCILAGHALNYGSDRVKETYLKPLVAGEKIGCFATTEPEASSDLSVRALRTKAERKGNGWVVNGQKRFITNACVADFVVALVAAEGKLSELVIELDSPGVRVGEPDKKMGMNQQLPDRISP